MSDVILLAPRDDVAVATRDLVPGEDITTGGDESTGDGGTRVVVLDRVPRGHKVALRDLPAGSEVRKYGQVIGRTTRPVPAGSQVHVHNLGMPDVSDVPGAPGTVDAAPDPEESAYATEHRELSVPDGERPTFLGYRRADGRVGTRNYVAIVTSVNCSASTARFVADQFRGRALAQFPHVDGIVALTHGSGCGLVPTSEGGRTLQRTLRGYAAHPNVGGVLVLGLGCEMLQVDALVAEAGIPADTLVRRLVIQETGGIRATVRAAVAEIEAMLPELDARRREVCDVSDLVLGLNCGGSDGYSGITANPALGVASDLLVAYGARSVLAETPEVYGAEHLLTRRAVSPEVGRRLTDRIAWWREYAAAGGGTLDNNPSPGNKAGGLTTILEKSLGAVAKAGSADLAAVYQYAEPIDTPGLGFMDTPGYDPVSVTGLVAGGATVVVFTTGRGSVLGCKPSPSIKVATNTAMYLRMHEDMDLNAGRIVDGTASLAEVGREIFDLVLAVASGRPTVSEELDLGQDEFQPWLLGTVT